jgi:hypothetical protein
MVKDIFQEPRYAWRVEAATHGARQCEQHQPQQPGWRKEVQIFSVHRLSDALRLVFQTQPRSASCGYCSLQIM